MDFDIVLNTRHSIRDYKSEPVEDEILNKIIETGKLAPTSRNKKPCDFIIVKDKEVLQKLAESKAAGSQMLKNAGAAIIVIADSEKSDVWIEDASIAMTYIHLAATNLGLGSCWIQLRNRTTKDGTDSGKYVKDLLNLEDKMQVLAILSIGKRKDAYAFYGWQTADVEPVDPKFAKIKNPKHLYDLLSNIWCAETCAPRMRAEWTKANQTYGQCSITAFLAQDIFGGEVYGILRAGGNYHCYNVIGNCIFDLTSEQFGAEVLCYENNPVQSRDVHFAKEEKRLRYEYLKAELIKELNKGEN